MVMIRKEIERQNKIKVTVRARKQKEQQEYRNVVNFGRKSRVMSSKKDRIRNTEYTVGTKAVELVYRYQIGMRSTYTKKEKKKEKTQIDLG